MHISSPADGISRILAARIIYGACHLLGEFMNRVIPLYSGERNILFFSPIHNQHRRLMDFISRTNRLETSRIISRIGLDFVDIHAVSFNGKNVKSLFMRMTVTCSSRSFFTTRIFNQNLYTPLRM